MNEEVKAYIGKMRDTNLFDALSSEEQDKTIFTSSELLKANYGKRKVSPTVIAFQVLYDLQAENEHYHHLKRQGVKSFSSKGVSVSFADGEINIAPEVKDILGVPNKGAGVGRLI